MRTWRPRRSRVDRALDRPAERDPADATRRCSTCARSGSTTPTRQGSSATARPIRSARATRSCASSTSTAATATPATSTSTPRTYGLGLGDDDEFEVHDLLGGGVYRWRGWHNYVDLTPGRGPRARVRRAPHRMTRDELPHTIPDLDLHLFAEGTHRRLYKQFGAQPGGRRHTVRGVGAGRPRRARRRRLRRLDRRARARADQGSSGVWCGWIDGGRCRHLVPVPGHDWRPATRSTSPTRSAPPTTCRPRSTR